MCHHLRLIRTILRRKVRRQRWRVGVFSLLTAWSINLSMVAVSVSCSLRELFCSFTFSNALFGLAFVVCDRVLPATGSVVAFFGPFLWWPGDVVFVCRYGCGLFCLHFGRLKNIGDFLNRVVVWCKDDAGS